MLKKIIKIFRFIIFFCTLILSLSIFALYAIFKYDDQLYIKSTRLPPSKSYELKELIGLHQFSNLSIKKYTHRIVSGNVNRKIIFDITIPIDEFVSFNEFINTQTLEIDSENESYLVFIKDSLVLDNQLYRLQIEYNTPDGDEVIGYVLDDNNIKFSKNTWLIITCFLLLLFVNSLIILPYKKIFILILKKRCPPK